ncbi:hypothetical protein [Hugenholtzia roseola]|uniref:hypothetical protein n=1 Tax=Hugenholtzia roseola TaxID=1002 RepID=UPI000423A4B0|nr:hypothetical protein [Hugenholtzia roseola]
MSKPLLYRPFQTAFFRAAWTAIALALTFLMAHSLTAHSHARAESNRELVWKKATATYFGVGFEMWLNVLTLDLGTEHLSHFVTEKYQKETELSKQKKQKATQNKAKLFYIQNYQQRLALQKSYWSWIGKVADGTLFSKNKSFFKTILARYFSSRFSQFTLSTSKAYFFSLQEHLGKNIWIGRAPPCIF